MAKDAVHMGPLGCGNVTKLFKNMVTASEALIVYEALQIAKAGGIGYKAALDLMQKTRSAHILERWETRYELDGNEMTFQSRHQSLRQRSAACRRSRQSAGRRDSGGRSARGIGNQVEWRQSQYLNNKRRDEGKSAQSKFIIAPSFFRLT